MDKTQIPGFAIESGEIIKRGLTPKQKGRLVHRLRKEGFRVSKMGHISPKTLPRGYPEPPNLPHNTRMSYALGFLRCYFPFTNPAEPDWQPDFQTHFYDVVLVNLHLTFPREYHSQVKGIAENLDLN